VYGGGTSILANLRLTGAAGTSQSAPVFASLLLYLIDKSLQLSGQPLGFVNPLLYAMRAADPLTFHDVTTGNNNCTTEVATGGCSLGGFTAAPGWDPVSGLGTPNIARMLRYLESLHLTQLSLSAGITAEYTDVNGDVWAPLSCSAMTAAHCSRVTTAASHGYQERNLPDPSLYSGLLSVSGTRASYVNQSIVNGVYQVSLLLYDFTVNASRSISAEVNGVRMLDSFQPVNGTASAYTAYSLLLSTAVTVTARSINITVYGTDVIVNGISIRGVSAP
jgi:hypothetical protein